MSIFIQGQAETRDQIMARIDELSITADSPADIRDLAEAFAHVSSVVVRSAAIDKPRRGVIL